jgi:flagellar motor switch protein FliM
MSPADPADPGGEASPLRADLSTEEITALLASRPGEVPGGVKAYLQRLAQDAQQSNRMPMLEIILDRFVRSVNTTMRNFTSENVDISMDNVTTQRYDEFLNGLTVPTMIAMLRSQKWGNYALVIVEAPLTYAVVDVLLGGRHGGDLRGLEGRSFTTIERRMIERVVRTLVMDLTMAFSAIGDPSFAFDRLETNPKFVMLARPDTPTTIATFRFYMEDRGGKFMVALPANLLYAVKDQLAQPFLGESSDNDNAWKRTLGDQVGAAPVRVDVVLDRVVVSLQDVLAWKPGSVLALNATPTSPVELRAENLTIATGEMGRVGSRVAVRVQ